MGFAAKQVLTYSLCEYDVNTLAHQKKKLLWQLLVLLALPFIRAAEHWRFSTYIC
jgi:tyrosine-protein phosphatase YwqE